jgi:acetylornithine/N-succinyldiaminopimelate aminotransferase
MPTYGRVDVSFARGEGAYLFDTAGRRYLDFTTGIAVVCLGHSHPHLVDEIRRQAGELMHCSNLFRIPGQEKLAERLVENSFADTVFFGNSGAEANECAIKMVRKYHHASGQPERYRVITFSDAFHGRTLATIAATGSAKVLEGFGPKVEGFDHVPYGDVDATAKAITPETGAIMIEPVQGEGGINVLPDGVLEELRQLCDEHGLLLVLDEVQSGMGRTGKLFAYEWTGATPDIATLGKGIGGGFPLGACLATEKAAVGMTPGTHGSTYGGNPMSVAAGNAVLDVMLQPGFMEHVLEMGEKLMGRLKALQRRNVGGIEEVRGKGLFIGVKFHANNLEVVNKLRDAGMLTVPAGQNVVRLLPPLTIDESHIDECMGIIEKVAETLAS